MKKIKVLTLLPLFLVNAPLVLFSGCWTKGPPHCGYYNGGTIKAWNNAGSRPVPVDTDGVIAKALFLNLRLWDTLYMCHAEQSVGLSNQAFALTKPINRDNLTIIDSVRILSNHDFDAAHPAGTNLLSLFNSPALNAGIQKIDIDTDTATFYLMHSPDDTGTHIFTIQTITKDPTMNISVKSEPIKLLK